MEDMYHCCRYCKHYKDGCCIRDNFDVEVVWVDEEHIKEVELYIKKPESFYCSNWE